MGARNLHKKLGYIRIRYAVSPQTHLNSTTATALQKIADVTGLNACSNECLYVVVVQFFQLQK